MKLKDYLSLVQLVFLIVVALHILRLIYQWPLTLGLWSAPMWCSWVAIIFCFWLVGVADQLKKKDRR